MDERLFNKAQERVPAYFCSSFSEYLAELVKRDIMAAEAAELAEQGKVAEQPAPYVPRTPSADNSQHITAKRVKGNISQKR